MKALFVAGTGTDLGKTHIACALLRAARARRLRVDAFKPVVSGFDPAAVRPTSHGLSGMRHRVESAGGRLSITSRPGNGTLVSAVLPLQQRPGAADTPLPKPAEA